MYNLVFPTVIFKKEYVELATKLLPIGKQLIEEHGGEYFETKLHRSTERSLHNNFDFLSLPEGKELLKILKYESIELLKYQRIDYTKYELTPYFIFNELKPGAHHKLHIHHGCIFSGCFYLDVPDGSSEIIFKDPRNYHQFIDYPYDYQSFNINDERPVTCAFYELPVSPKTGDLMMWNSWLPHEVTRNESHLSRYTLVFNIN